VVAKFIGHDHVTALPAFGHLSSDTTNTAHLNPITCRQRELACALHCSQPGKAHEAVLEKQDELRETLPKMNEEIDKANWQAIASRVAAVFVFLAGVLLAARLCGASPLDNPVPSILEPRSTPAESIRHLSYFVLSVTGLIFLTVFSLLSYAVVKFRSRVADSEREPAQVYGSTQIELAWTIIPILIVVVLFLATARVIHAIQDAPKPSGALEVIAIGHQFWWEFRYPKLGIVTANELHVPVSDTTHPTPTFVKLLSADTNHGFWIPQLAGKTDLIPNRVNETWLDPHDTGLFLGQCAQYCGTQHAKMLLRVSVESPEDFEAWVRIQKQSAQQNEKQLAGRHVFETTACVNCHTVTGTNATGRFGPDLTHLMSRQTLAAGAADNTRENLRLWIQNPEAIKPGSLMPAMQLSDADLDSLVRYLETLQ
jgi:cytochrome c oxidase subunit 2